MAGIKHFLLALYLIYPAAAAFGQLSEGWVLEKADDSKAIYQEGRSIVEFTGDVLIRNGNDSYASENFRYEENDNIIVMKGNVLVDTKDYYVSSDYLEYDISQERAMFSGNVKAGMDTASIKARRAVVRTGSRKMEFYEDVSFTRDKLISFSDNLLYDDSGDLIVLTGNPYISMEDDYIGGDRITIHLLEGEEPDKIEVNGHGDLYWAGDARIIDMRAGSIIMKFEKENLSYVNARDDVHSLMTEDNDENRLQCDFMDVFLKKGKSTA